MNKKFISYYSIFVGLAVISMWTLILLQQEIPEGKTEMSFHLFSEFSMAIFCIVSGIMILYNHGVGRLLNILGLGMVLYSLINAAGYYGERASISMMILFLVLFLLTIFTIVLNLRLK